MNMTIAKRLMIMMAVTLVSLVLVGGAGFFSIADLRASLDNTNRNILPSLNIIDALEIDLLQTRINLQLHVMATNDEIMQKAEAGIKTHKENIAKEIKQYEPLILDAQDKTLFEKANQSVEAYLGKIDMVLNLSRNNQDEEARDLLLREVTPQGEAAYEALEAVAQYNEKTAKDSSEHAENSASRSLAVVALAIFLAVAAIGGIGVLLIRGINSALRVMRDTVAHIEQNLDFTRRAEVKTQDEIGQTAGALNRLIERMQRNLKEIAGGAHEVARASEQLSDTSDQVAQAANQQSSAASSMAATVEEMTVSINHVGDRAGEANAVSEESGRLAASGEKVIGQTVADINEIAHAVEAAADQIRQLEVQSQGISSVVAVIKEVADQTNLLALNAAIEAARAGEQGRGFAVVADEVRKLAERTSASTQEIAAMVDSIRSGAKSAVDGMGGAVDRVSVGVEHARDASDAIQKIGAGSRDAVRMVSEITTSIREQSSASNNIAQQVERIASMAEQSSAAAQESAESARSLDRLAIRMQEIVAAYRL